MELSNAAASCYALAGRLRNAGLMRSDVADALAARRDDAAAATLYEHQARLFLAEAWHQLSGLLLRKLARAQQVTADPCDPARCPSAGLRCGDSNYSGQLASIGQAGNLLSVAAFAVSFSV